MSILRRPTAGGESAILGTAAPADAEILFLAAGLARDGGDRAEAERLYRELLSGTDAPHFGSVDAALRGPKARHNLGLLLAEAGRTAEAFDQWRIGVREDPAFVPTWLAQAEWSPQGGDGEGEREALRQVVELRPDLGMSGGGWLRSAGHRANHDDRKQVDRDSWRMTTGTRIVASGD